MKIAVMGMGVAGSYLMARLRDSGHEVTGYERATEERHDSICAWGTVRAPLEEFCKKVGIDFGDYVMHTGKSLHVDIKKDIEFDIKLEGLCTYDKLQLIKDFVKDSDVKYGRAPKLSEIESEYDLVVDCTGFHRSYLPKIKDDFYVPTYEYKIEYEGDVPYDDFYVKPFPGKSGYFWYFPLDKNTAHVGAGDSEKHHVEHTDEFLKTHGGRVTKTKGRPIRLSTPNLCKPFYSGKVVGVGESIGTVYTLFGEGIIPSMQCAEIFLEHMHDPAAYERAVEKHFRIYNLVYNFIRSRGSKYARFWSLFSIYLYMRKHKKRFGMSFSAGDMLKLTKI